MRVMLANMLPWAEFRRTYGAAIATRELVQRRIGRLAGPDRRLRCAGRLVLVAARPGLPRRDGVHHRQDLRQRGAEGSGHRAVHEDARRPVVPPRPHLRRQRPRVPRPLHLRGRGRDARHGVLQVAGQGARQGASSSRSARRWRPPASSKPNPLNPAHAWALRKALVPYAKWRVGETFAAEPSAEFPGLLARAWPRTPSSPPTASSAAGWRSAA